MTHFSASYGFEVICMAKTFFRCTVCGDVHFGRDAPEICPTCGAKNAYVGIDAEEAKELMDF